MLTRSHFSVDLWFIFGSFCYGAEARLVACHPDHLLLRMNSTSPSAQSELTAFFDSINEKARSLVRTEVRIFVNSHPNEPSADWAEELIATLMTDLKPRLIFPDDGAGISAVLQLELLDVCGLTPNDQAAWSNLVTDVWPQLPA